MNDFPWKSECCPIGVHMLTSPHHDIENSLLGIDGFSDGLALRVPLNVGVRQRSPHHFLLRGEYTVRFRVVLRKKRDGVPSGPRRNRVRLQANVVRLVAFASDEAAPKRRAS